MIKNIKVLFFCTVAFVLFFGLSCDDRVPVASSAVIETGSIELTYALVDGIPNLSEGIPPILLLLGKSYPMKVPKPL